MGFKLRDYQEEIVNKGKAILDTHNMLYLAMEVRTGKTFCALFCSEGAKKVLFVTKKKAISSIKDDYETSGLNYKFEVINYESFHKADHEDVDILILDEAHGIGAFPKPNKRARDIADMLDKSPKTKVIFLSGTPTPESYSQIFHQFWVKQDSPLAKAYKNFYQFANHHVDKKEKTIAYGRVVNDYSDCRKDEVFDKISHLFVEFSQKQAGFSGEIKEHILRVKMKDSTYKVINQLKKNLVIGDRVIADTPVKLQSKLHQMYSGSIKLEDGTRTGFDRTKGEFIKSHFKGKKIAMFYKFIAEYEILKEVFGDNLCNDIATFDANPEKHIALQIQSGREGTKLANADVLVFYNIDFSATSYWQGRDRMTTMDRKFNDVYWIFSEGGIEDKIYNTVVKKKSYTTYYFKRDFGLNKKKKPQLKMEL